MQSHAVFWPEFLKGINESRIDIAELCGRIKNDYQWLSLQYIPPVGWLFCQLCASKHGRKHPHQYNLPTGVLPSTATNLDEMPMKDWMVLLATSHAAQELQPLAHKNKTRYWLSVENLCEHFSNLAIHKNSQDRTLLVQANHVLHICTSTWVVPETKHSRLLKQVRLKHSILYVMNSTS